MKLVQFEDGTYGLRSCFMFLATDGTFWPQSYRHLIAYKTEEEALFVLEKFRNNKKRGKHKVIRSV